MDAEWLMRAPPQEIAKLAALVPTLFSPPRAH
jgi:hypothetical protein